MLFSSSDEEARALIQKYNDLEETYEKNLFMLSIKSEGKLSITEIYQMPFLMRKRYVESFNEFVEEKNRKNS